MIITSGAFTSNQSIPKQFTCDGDDNNPPLQFGDIPANTRSLVLIFDDPDAPAGTANPGWVHWIMYSISPNIKEIPQNSVPLGAIQGQNDWGRNDYGGPCPHSGTHRYVFRLLALDTDLSLAHGAKKAEVLAAAHSHIIAEAQLIGTYERP